VSGGAPAQRGAPVHGLAQATRPACRQSTDAASIGLLSRFSPRGRPFWFGSNMGLTRWPCSSRSTPVEFCSDTLEGLALTQLSGSVILYSFLYSARIQAFCLALGERCIRVAAGNSAMIGIEAGAPAPTEPRDPIGAVRSTPRASAAAAAADASPKTKRTQEGTPNQRLKFASRPPEPLGRALPALASGRQMSRKSVWQMLADRRAGLQDRGLPRLRQARRAFLVGRARSRPFRAKMQQRLN
jgi:hypothetical protein